MNMRLFTLSLATALTAMAMPADAVAAGDRSADIRLIHGTTGLRGQVVWGDAGVRLDFSYPVSPGRSAEATLAIQAETGETFLILHGTGEVVEGHWPVGEHPSPVDLLSPGLTDLRMDYVGKVVLGQLECDVKAGGRDQELRVWYPTAFPDIPRMARLVSAEGAAELSLSKVRPSTLTLEDLTPPKDYDVLPFGMSDLMIRATDSPEAAVFGARAAVWLATSNLEKQAQNVEYYILVEADPDPELN